MLYPANKFILHTNVVAMLMCRYPMEVMATLFRTLPQCQNNIAKIAK